VGERVSARSGSMAGPVGRCDSGPSPICAIVVIFSGALTDDPGHSRGREGGGSTKLFAVVSFGRKRPGAPLDRRLFSVEDADSPWTFSGLVEPSPNRVDHLMLSWSLVGTPDRPLCRPMRCPAHAPRGWCGGVDLRAEGPCCGLPVRVGRARAREHLPSSRKPASKPANRTSTHIFGMRALSAHRFAFSRLVPRVRRCFELPSG
jgi:hypothetical protein